MTSTSTSPSTSPTTPTTPAASSPARSYEEFFVPAIFRPLAAMVLGAVPPRPGDHVLDVACGTGVLTRLSAELAEGGRVVGVDVSPGMLEVANAVATEQGHAIEWQVGDGTALEQPDDAYDVVLCQQGLQFFPDRAAGAREMRRVLRPGGRIGIAAWQGLDRHPLYAALAEAQAPLLERFGVPAAYDDVVAPFSLGDPEALAALLTDAGIAEVAVLQDHIVARFATPDRFLERLEHAYAAVVPAFVEDPTAFRDYLDALHRETEPIIATYRDGDHIAVPMHTNIAIGWT